MDYRPRIIVPSFKTVPLKYGIAYWGFFVIALPAAVCLGAF